MKYAAIEEIPVDTQTGVISDSVIRLTGPKTSKWYPDTLRMVVYEDYATGYVYRFLTNDFTHSYLTIAELYRERWQVECLFYDKHIIMQSSVARMHANGLAL